MFEVSLKVCINHLEHKPFRTYHGGFASIQDHKVIACIFPKRETTMQVCVTCGGPCPSRLAVLFTRASKCLFESTPPRTAKVTWFESCGEPLQRDGSSQDNQQLNMVGSSIRGTHNFVILLEARIRTYKCMASAFVLLEGPP